MLELKQLMRKDTPDTFGVKDLQNAILNIAHYIDMFCSSNNIEYCLMSGSAIGAVRHGGFIPWDDDLDVFMTPDNYEKFREAFKEIGDNETFYLQELGASEGMVDRAKLRLNGSIFEESMMKDAKIHQGIFVDIFLLHACPDGIIKSRWQYLWAKYIMLKGLANRDFNIKGSIGWIIKLMRVFLPKRFMLSYALKQVYRFRNEESEYLCHFFGRARYKKGLYRRAHFSKMKRVPFETIELCVPENVHEYLTERWGDYMKIPPIETIYQDQHASSWNIDHAEPYDTTDERFYI